jgi:hypothetical protein
MLLKKETTENQSNFYINIFRFNLRILYFFSQFCCGENTSFAHDLSILPQMPDKLIIDSMTDVKTENAKSSK